MEFDKLKLMSIFTHWHVMVVYVTEMYGSILPSFL